MLEIIAKVFTGTMVLGWMVSLVCFTKNKVWQNICCCISFLIFGVGFVICLNTIFCGWAVIK